MEKWAGEGRKSGSQGLGFHPKGSGEPLQDLQLWDGKISCALEKVAVLPGLGFGPPHNPALGSNKAMRDEGTALRERWLLSAAFVLGSLLTPF